MPAEPVMLANADCEIAAEFADDVLHAAVLSTRAIKSLLPNPLPAKTSDADTIVKHDHLASALPPAAWRTSLYDIVWSVKLLPNKGFQPLRPMVLSTREFDVPAQKAVTGLLPSS